MKTFSRILGLAILFASFVASSAVIAAEKITYIHTDAFGSPVAATDEQGNVVWRETYQPYGERIQNQPDAATNTRWYTGHPQDPETGLIYAGARYYDPAIVRFMAIDPAPFSEKNIHSFNRYAYGNNNPYRYIDPDGRCVMNVTGSAEGAQAALGDCMAGRGEFGADFLDYALNGMDIAVPVGGGVKLGGRILEGTGAAAKTATRELPKPTGVPDNWIATPSRKGGGTKYVNPNNPHDYVRVMPANPKSPNPAQQQPYTVRMKDGKAIDGSGNPVSLTSPEAHIPSDKFKFIP